ncbi:MAG: peptide chain release factor N(5)-glutamine methyltransferase [Nitrospirae bacterium]|nr:peptide chain release factor N(5)-glutamine methyltransferase [Nitrospirota bacterium]
MTRTCERRELRRAATVGRVLALGAGRLAAAGVAEPRLDAELLLADQLSEERLALYREPGRLLPPAARRRFNALLRRRALGEPLQYLRGRVEFFGLECDIRRGALIPRPDTELLVELAIDRLRAAQRGVDHPVRFADVGTGSGCIAMGIASAVETAVGAALDCSARALVVARRNFDRHGLADRMMVRRGDLCEPLRRESWRADLIAANLPYIPTGVIETLESQIRDHEPRLALDGGADGLDLIRRLVQTAADSLLPGGWLLLEVGIGQADRVAALARHAGWRVEAIERDLSGIDRVVVLSRKGNGE